MGVWVRERKVEIQERRNQDRDYGRKKDVRRGEKGERWQWRWKAGRQLRIFIALVHLLLIIPRCRSMYLLGLPWRCDKGHFAWLAGSSYFIWSVTTSPCPVIGFDSQHVCNFVCVRAHTHTPIFIYHSLTHLFWPLSFSPQRSASRGFFLAGRQKQLKYVPLLTASCRPCSYISTPAEYVASHILFFSILLFW